MKNPYITTKESTKKEFLESRKGILDLIEKYKSNIYQFNIENDREDNLIIQLQINPKKVIK